MHRKPLNTAMRRTRRGFTLIELMVVIVILGILGTAGLFFFGGAIGQAEYGRAGAELSSMGNGAQTYKVNKRVWPATIDELGNMTDSNFNKEDPWKMPYRFTLLDDNILEIRSSGADKTMDNEDDIFWNSKTGIYNPQDDPGSAMNQKGGGASGGGGGDI